MSSFVSVLAIEQHILAHLDTDELIRVLDNYKGSSGKKYKSDYRAILTWTVERVQSKSPWLFKKQSGGDSRGSLDDYDYGSMEGSL